MQGALLTGARPGELPKIKRSAYDSRTGTVKLKSGKSGTRDVTHSPAGVALFDRLTKSKSPDELLFVRRDDEPWTRIEWSGGYPTLPKPLRPRRLPRPPTPISST